MANEEHLAILKQGVETWNHWRKNSSIWPDLREADLNGARLSRADLSGADLYQANLSGANLYRPDLSEASLYQADLSGANLYQPDLSGADLREADLSGADLSRANLSRANLSGANLSEADLRRANFVQANLSGADLSRAIVGYTVFGDVDLSAAKGLETVQHLSPSTLGVDTLYKSRGKIPEVFLRGCGIPDQTITFIASLAGQPETYRVRLRMMIDEHFNKGELQTLCFDMNLDYDGLNGENKSDKARELVAYFQRRGTIRDLVAKCKELRSNVSWEGEYE